MNMSSIGMAMMKSLMKKRTQPPLIRCWSLPIKFSLNIDPNISLIRRSKMGEVLSPIIP